MTDTSTAVEHYHDPDDKRFARDLRKSAPDAFNAFVEFDNQALRSANKVIPRKYTELMALAVALTTQCAYCIEGHTAAAHAEGATDDSCTRRQHHDRSPLPALETITQRPRA